MISCHVPVLIPDLVLVMIYDKRVMGPWLILLSIPILTLVWFAFLILYAWIFGDMRQKVYIWGFPCLDYSFDVLVSWERNLSVYNHFCLQLDLLGFPVPWWLGYTCPYIYHTCVLTPIFALATWLQLFIVYMSWFLGFAYSDFEAWNAVKPST